MLRVVVLRRLGVRDQGRWRGMRVFFRLVYYVVVDRVASRDRGEGSRKTRQSEATRGGIGWWGLLVGWNADEDGVLKIGLRHQQSPTVSRRQMAVAQHSPGAPYCGIYPSHRLTL